MDLDLLELSSAASFHWRGPSPYYFITVPDDASAAIHAVANAVTYGWGMIPVEVRIGDSVWETSLFPKDGRYLVPISRWSGSASTWPRATLSRSSSSFDFDRPRAERAPSPISQAIRPGLPSGRRAPPGAVSPARCPMSLASAALVAPTTRPMGRVHVVGAGPVGLFLTALLQSIDGQAVRLYERRDEYTRTRMVSLAEYLIADSIESYKADPIDGQNVEAIFDPTELETRLAYRRTIAPDLRALLEEWTRGFVPLNTIERSLSELIDARGHRHRRAGRRRGHRRAGASRCWSPATSSSTARAPGR